MNLTMNSTVIELSVHACNFVHKVMHREEIGARVWPFSIALKGHEVFVPKLNKPY